MSYRINFYIEKRKDETGKLITKKVPIYLFFSYDGKRLQYYSGFRLNESQWNSEDQKMKRNNFNDKGESSQYINSQLEIIKNTVREIYESAIILKITPTNIYIRNELKKRLNANRSDAHNHFFGRYEQYISKSEISDRRKKQLTSTMNHFKRFMNGKNVTFDSITQQTIINFKEYLKKDSFENEKEKPKGYNTIIGILKKLKAFFNYAAKEGWTKENPFKDFKLGQEKYGSPIYLTKKELDHLYNYDLSNEPRLEKIRDIFIFQCLIGCRVDDLIRLTKSNVVNGAIEYVPGKTKRETPKPVRVILSDKANTILSKYDLPNGMLLPFISQPKLNDGIKDLFKHVELERKVVRLNPLTQIEETVKICDIASSHMARRTFIGILHRKYKNEVIASMTGHRDNSRAFSRYYSIDDEVKAEAVKDFDS